MTDGPTDDELAKFLGVARRAARTASKDDQVVEGAADHAVVQLQRYWDAVAPNEGARTAWVKVVAVNEARRSAAKGARDLPFGRGGSLLPEFEDEAADRRAADLVAEMHRGGGSLASDVVMQVDFDPRWALLSEEHRELLEAKYGEGRRSKEIARRRGRGETEAQVNHLLADARRAARLVLEDLLYS